MKKITDYKPLQRNPNKGTQKGAGIIDESVRTLGAGRSLLVDKDGVIIAGNHAQEAFVNAGMENVIEVETDGSQIVVVKRTDMTADSIAGKKMAIMDNRASELGLAWDEVILEEMMEEISAEDGELDKFLEDLAKDEDIELESNAGGDTEPEIDKAEELRVKWGVELGQMWRLGQHRIICGDCTDKAVVERLMGGEKADMVFTDPPYGDGHAGMVVDVNRARVGKSIVTEIKKIESDKNLDFLQICVSVINDYLKDKSTKMMFFKWSKWDEVLLSTSLWGFPSSVCVWDRKEIAAATFRFNPVHEFCFHWGNLKDKHDVSNLTNVWSFPRETDSKEMHPTVKPQEILSPAISVCTSDNAVILDPFVGSGSIIIACENLHRQCRAVEISPAYVAVAIERWHQHTGLMPELME